MSKTTYAFVCDTNDFASIGRSNKAILIGSSSFISMNEIRLDNYSPLEPRYAISSFKRLYMRNPRKVHLSINEDIVIAAPKNVQFAFAYDAFLKWGYGTKGNCILLGGISSPGITHLQVFVFQNGDLVETEEREFDGHESVFYEDTILGIIEELENKYPDSKVHYAAPLPLFTQSAKQFHYLSEDIYKSLSFQKLGISTKSQSNSIALPLAIVGLSSCAAAMVLMKGWSDYNTSIESFYVAMSDPIVKQDGGVGGNFIDKMTRQRSFMMTPVYQGELTSMTTKLVLAATRIKSGKIVSLQVTSPSLTTDGRSNVQIVLSVPVSNRLALEQGKEILDVISGNAGLTLHMASAQGWKDIEKNRIFTFEGNLDIQSPESIPPVVPVSTK